MSKIEIDLDVITDTMDNLKKEKARLEFDLKEVNKEIEKYELQLIALLGQMKVREMDYKCYSFGLKEISRTALDQKYLKEHYSFEDVPKCLEWLGSLAMRFVYSVRCYYLSYQSMFSSYPLLHDNYATFSAYL